MKTTTNHSTPSAVKTMHVPGPGRRRVGRLDGVPDAVPHVVTFTPSAGGGTELSVTESGYTMPQARDMSQLGLDQCLDKLAAALLASR